MGKHTRTGHLALLLVIAISWTESPAAIPGDAARKLRIVVLGAHCDDPETGAGGLIAILTRDKHEVICVYPVTYRGGRTIKGQPEDTVRRREAEAACKVLGAIPKFFPYAAEAFWCDPDTLKAVSKWLDEIKPDIVLTHWPFDTHPNHNVVSSLAWLNYKPKGGWNLYFFEVYTGVQSLGFRAELYLDIEPVAEIKKRAIECHASQRPDLLWRDHDAMHRHRGQECGCRRAEAYFLLEAKDGCPLLPVTFRSAEKTIARYPLPLR